MNTVCATHTFQSNPLINCVSYCLATDTNTIENESLMKIKNYNTVNIKKNVNKNTNQVASISRTTTNLLLINNELLVYLYNFTVAC